MQKMLIKLDEERIKHEGKYDLEAMWKIIDKAFEEGQCIKEVQPDGSVMYSGNPNRDNYLSDFAIAYSKLLDEKLFAEYALDWKWYTDEETSTGEFIDMEPMEDLKEEHGLFIG